MSETLNRILFWILAVCSLAADQSSKYIIFDMLSDPATNHVHSLFQSQQGGGFHLVAQFQYDLETRQMKKDSRGNPIPYVNQGALFGFLGNHQSLANGLFAVISCAAAMAIIFWSTQKGSLSDLGLTIALGFILGGTLGNFYDFFDWPVFNLADCWLVGGACLLMLLAFRVPKENAQTPADPAT